MNGPTTMQETTSTHHTLILIKCWISLLPLQQGSWLERNKRRTMPRFWARLHTLSSRAQSGPPCKGPQTAPVGTFRTSWRNWRTHQRSRSWDRWFLYSPGRASPSMADSTSPRCNEGPCIGLWSPCSSCSRNPRRRLQFRVKRRGPLGVRSRTKTTLVLTYVPCLIKIFPRGIVTFWFCLIHKVYNPQNERACSLHN